MRLLNALIFYRTIAFNALSCSGLSSTNFNPADGPRLRVGIGCLFPSRAQARSMRNSTSSPKPTWNRIEQLRRGCARIYRSNRRVEYRYDLGRLRGPTIPEAPGQEVSIPQREPSAAPLSSTENSNASRSVLLSGANSAAWSSRSRKRTSVTRTPQ
jgi:hypothetical protein